MRNMIRNMTRKMTATMKIGDVTMLMIIVNVMINGLKMVMQQSIMINAISLCARNALKISDLHNEVVASDYLY